MGVRAGFHNSVIFKMIFIGILMIVLLVPLFLIRGVINERKERRSDAVFDVGSKWGSIQTISGPLLTVPYIKYYKDEEDRLKSRKEYMQFLPYTVNIAAHIDTEIRRRGIFDVPVYTLDLQCNGTFSNIAVPEEDILWDEVHLFVGISDLRGIQETVYISWDGEQYSFEPGAVVTELFTSGIHVDIPKHTLHKNSPIKFSFSLHLNGSEELYFMPSGKETRVKATSIWPDPSFAGSYLPVAYETSKDGFSATWQVSYLSRNYQQFWQSDSIDFSLLGNNIMASTFGVKLFMSVDHYHKVTRSVKYGVLFIALTFAAFFLFEMMSNLSIHPFQYLLVGFAMSLFYLLLLSLSEHLDFTFSYIISSVCTIGLIVGYSSHALVLKRRSFVLSVLLLLLYACLFILLQLEDYALLYGTIFLLSVLAFIMLLTRKVDWYSIKLKTGGGQDSP